MLSDSEPPRQGGLRWREDYGSVFELPYRFGEVEYGGREVVDAPVRVTGRACCGLPGVTYLSGPRSSIVHAIAIIA